MNADKEQSAPIFFWEGEELLRMRSLAKRRKKKLMECLETIVIYQSIVMDQEIQLVDLQAEACLRASEFNEMQKILLHATGNDDA